MARATPAARSRLQHLAWLMAVLAISVGCSNVPRSEPESRGATPPPRVAASPPPAAVDGRPRIVFLGDSLTAGYGLPAEQAYPALIEERLKERGLEFEVVNAGVSGDTSAGGLRRLEWSLQGDVRVVVIALGGNDGLRGLLPGELKRNLEAMIRLAHARDVDVLLLGMEAPPNFGPDYTRHFRAVYTALARERGVRVVPFFLEGVAGVPALNLPDGIHPNAEGHRRVADLVWRELEPMLAPSASR